MSNVIPIRPNMASSKEKRIAIAMASVVGSVALGVAGTLGVQNILHRKHIAEGDRLINHYLRPAVTSIGSMAVTYLEKNPKQAKLDENGDWGEPTISINTKDGTITVGMERTKGKLDPRTTNGVEVDLIRPDVADLLRGGGFEEVFIDKQSGSWDAKGQVYIDPSRNRVVSLGVSASDPNLMNAYALSQKAQEMAREVLGLEVPPWSKSLI